MADNTDMRARAANAPARTIIRGCRIAMIAALSTEEMPRFSIVSS